MRLCMRMSTLPAALLLCGVLSAWAEDDKKDRTPQVYPAALLPFQERGREARNQGSKVADLLFAKLSADASLTLVDREDIKKLLDEQELDLSGLVNPQQATKVGQLTGAKLLITGSVLQVDNSVHLVAKIIGTETSRVVGASVTTSSERNTPQHAAAGQSRRRVLEMTFAAADGVTNVTSLRNATTMGRSHLGAPSQAVVWQPEVPRLSECHSMG